MNLLEVSIVNIAIPSIQRNLQASYAGVQWALAGHTLAYALVAAAGRVIAGTGGSAVRRDFAASLQRTLWFQVGVFGLSFLLMLELPARAGRRPAGAQRDPNAAGSCGYW